MRHSFLLEVIVGLRRLPGAMWCYFVHSWKHWEECEDEDFKWREWRYQCGECKRYWQRISY